MIIAILYVLSRKPMFKNNGKFIMWIFSPVNEKIFTGDFNGKEK